jgi:chromosomal replication initiator protein
LVRLVAYASMYDEAVTLDFVERVAAPFFDRDPDQAGLPVSSDAVFARVCDQYEVTLKALRSRDRTAHISRARRVAAYLLRELGTLSYPEIGTALGGRTHTTVIHAVNRVQEELQEDPHFRHAMMKVRYELSGRAAEAAS